MGVASPGRRRASPRSGPTVTDADQVDGSSPSTNETRSRTASATPSASSAGSRGVGPPATVAGPHCSISMDRRGSRSARWASTQRRQAVSPGATNGPTVRPPGPGATTRWGRPARRTGSSRRRGSTSSEITSAAVASSGRAASPTPEAWSSRVARPRSVGASTRIRASARAARRRGASSPNCAYAADTAPRSAASRRARSRVAASTSSPRASRSATSRRAVRDSVTGRTPARRSSSTRRVSGSSGTTRTAGGSTPTCRCRSSRRTTCSPGRSAGRRGNPGTPAVSVATSGSMREGSHSRGGADGAHPQVPAAHRARNDGGAAPVRRPGDAAVELVGAISR